MRLRVDLRDTAQELLHKFIALGRERLLDIREALLRLAIDLVLRARLRAFVLLVSASATYLLLELVQFLLLLGLNLGDLLLRLRLRLLQLLRAV